MPGKPARLFFTYFMLLPDKCTPAFEIIKVIFVNLLQLIY